MSTGISISSKCCSIRRIARFRHLLLRWRHKASQSLSGRRLSVPLDVPAGHIAVIVGATRRRFVIRASYLNHPAFKNLLRRAEEEYGFSNSGLLMIPCDESVFEEILRFMSRTGSESIYNSVRLEDFQRNCNLEMGNGNWTETRPLLG